MISPTGRTIPHDPAYFAGRSILCTTCPKPVEYAEGDTGFPPPLSSRLSAP
jgi:hypothetical protein